MRGHFVVTGCAGFIGSHLADRVLADGHTVTYASSSSVYGDGTQTRDFIYVDDIAEGLVLAQGAPPGAVMNLGGGNRVSLGEAIATLGEIAGVEPVLSRQGVEAGDVSDTCADVSRAAEAIGYTPTTRLKAGLAQEFAWLADIGDLWTVAELRR